MHSDEQALLDAIIENPEDDTLRLVYADWLDEQGGAERAQFIRWKILGLAAMGVTGNTDELMARARNDEFATIATKALNAFADAAPEGCSKFFRRKRFRDRLE